MIFQLFWSLVIFIAPIILFLLFVIPKVNLRSIGGTHSDSCYVTSFIILAHILTKIVLMYIIAFIRSFDDRYKVDQNICSYFNFWIKTLKETVYLLLIFFLVLLCDTGSAR
jgi:hypothetical protein